MAFLTWPIHPFGRSNPTTLQANYGTGKTDFHEFMITENNTALVEAFVVTQTDLTAVGGPANGYVYNCVFQEVDIASGAVLFEWRALDHVPVSETMFSLGTTGTNSSTAFD